MGKNLTSTNTLGCKVDFNLSTDPDASPLETWKSVTFTPPQPNGERKSISPFDRNGARETIETLRAGYLLALFGNGSQKPGVHVFDVEKKGAVKTSVCPLPAVDSKDLKSTIVVGGEYVSVVLPYHEVTDKDGTRNKLTLTRREHQAGRWCHYTKRMSQAYLTLPEITLKDNGEPVWIVQPFEMFHNILDLMLEGYTVTAVVSVGENRTTHEPLTWLQDEARKLYQVLNPTDDAGNPVAFDLTAARLAYREAGIQKQVVRTQMNMGRAGAKREREALQEVEVSGTPSDQPLKGITPTCVLNGVVTEISAVPFGVYAGIRSDGSVDPKLAFVLVQKASDRIILNAANRTFKTL